MSLVKEAWSRPARTAPASDGARDRRPWVKAMAAVALVLLAMRIPLAQGVEIGYLGAALLSPVWIRALLGHRLGSWIAVSGLVAAASGIALQIALSDTHEINTNVATRQTVLVIGSVLALGLVVWARTVLTSSRVGLWFGVGLLLSVSPTSSLFQTNPWKFGFALPVAVIALAVAHLVGRWWAELLVVLALTGISAVSDARSAFGLLLLAGILIVAQFRFFRAGHRGSAVLVLIGMVVIAGVVAFAGQRLILDGYLGEQTQARSQAQVTQSGSLVVGGRPELAATLALMQHQFSGYGAGTAPLPDDVLAAKTGMTAIGYDPENGYVDDYMFGGHIELHSTIGDLWAQCGVMGLVFSGLILVALIWGSARRIADGQASGLLLFLVGDGVFNLFFSPFLTTAPTLVLALGLVLLPGRAQRRANTRISSMGPSNDRPRGSRPAASRMRSSSTADAAG